MSSVEAFRAEVRGRLRARPSGEFAALRCCGWLGGVLGPPEEARA